MSLVFGKLFAASGSKETYLISMQAAQLFRNKTGLHGAFHAAVFAISWATLVSCIWIVRSKYGVVLSAIRYAGGHPVAMIRFAPKYQEPDCGMILTNPHPIEKIRKRGVLWVGVECSRCGKIVRRNPQEHPFLSSW